MRNFSRTFFIETESQLIGKIPTNICYLFKKRPIPFGIDIRLGKGRSRPGALVFCNGKPFRNRT